MELHVEDGAVVKVAGNKDHPTNSGRLCTKGATSAQALRVEGRLDGAFVDDERARDQVRVPVSQAIADAASDFYDRDELEALQSRGVLNRLDLAFSRDQAERIDVQDRMIQHGRELYDWLERGAHLYVCGDASRMAKDVETALRAIVEEHGGHSTEAAKAYVQKLGADKRYVRDVY